MCCLFFVLLRCAAALRCAPLRCAALFCAALFCAADARVQPGQNVLYTGMTTSVMQNVFPEPPGPWKNIAARTPLVLERVVIEDQTQSENHPADLARLPNPKDVAVPRLQGRKHRTDPPVSYARRGQTLGPVPSSRGVVARKRLETLGAPCLTL